MSAGVGFIFEQRSLDCWSCSWTQDWKWNV